MYRKQRYLGDFEKQRKIHNKMDYSLGSGPPPATIESSPF